MDLSPHIFLLRPASSPFHPAYTTVKTRPVDDSRKLTALYAKNLSMYVDEVKIPE